MAAREIDPLPLQNITLRPPKGAVLAQTHHLFDELLTEVETANL
jgi:hypothetical protein